MNCMNSLQTNLKQIRDLLNQTSAAGRVYHYTRPDRSLPSWVVWSEDSEAESHDANNVKIEQQVHGTIDCYSKTEYDPLFDEIQTALNDAGIGWNLLSVQYEDETSLIHYEWEFYVS